MPNNNNTRGGGRRYGPKRTIFDRIGAHPYPQTSARDYEVIKKMQPMTEFSRKVVNKISNKLRSTVGVKKMPLFKSATRSKSKSTSNTKSNGSTRKNRKG